jgi:hypothetical protein
MKVGVDEYYPVYCETEDPQLAEEVPDIPPVLWEAYLSAKKDFDSLREQIRRWIHSH